MARHLIQGIAIVVLLGACSAESPPTPSPADQEYLAYAERIDLVVACVEEHGFEASSYEGFGTMVHAAGEEQLDVAGRIEGECWEEVEQHFPAPPPLSLEETYSYMLDVADCLRDLGYDIPEVPSLECISRSGGCAERHVGSIHPSGCSGRGHLRATARKLSAGALGAVIWAAG